jgi:eukaryotic-like serine/threonine-protein kinase
MTWTVPGYTEIRELGRGASGRVVLAQHHGNGAHVAIKYLADQLLGNEEFIRSFRAEARIMSEVDDQQIARLYEYIETPEGAAIVMELVDGVALRAILREQGPTEPEVALLVLKGSLLGLAAAHGRGVVHRDYKPENVLVDANGQSKLADFGIATRSGRQGPLAGTPSYMAPEQWKGSPASPSTDIYAATATFFECLTGHPPFRAPGDLAGLRRLHEQAPVPIELVPEAVRGLVRRGLAKETGQRPGDAKIFLRELEAVAGANYGPDWEEEGRGKLARRALLLALLFPFAAAAVGGSSTAMASTWLGGLTTKAKYSLLAGGTAIVLAIAVIGGIEAFGGDPAADVGDLPPASAPAGPSPTPAASPSPSPSASPSAEPSPSASPSALPSPSKPPSPRPSSPRPPSPSPSKSTPPNTITSWSIQTFCWWYSKQVCFNSPTGTGRVVLTVNTSQTTAFDLKLSFRELTYSGQQIGSAVTITTPVQAGSLTRDLTIDQNLSIFNNCTQASLIHVSIAASIPGPGPEPTATIADYPCNLR